MKLVEMCNKEEALNSGIEMENIENIENSADIIKNSNIENSNIENSKNSGRSLLVVGLCDLELENVILDEDEKSASSDTDFSASADAGYDS